MNHLDDEAELYALGLLEAAERDRVDEHVRVCDACLRRVGAAEAAVAALTDASVIAAVPARAGDRRWPFALAAASLLACAASLATAFGLHRASDDDGAVIARLVDSHFAHVQFAAPGGRPIAAKAIYERHGAWYIIVATGAPAWHVVIVEPNGTRVPVAHAFAQRGGSSILTIDDPPPVRAIELEDAAGTTIARAQPTAE